jgi:uncharacterized protein (DUF4415 family)
MPRKPKPTLITDDAPVADAAWFKRAKPARDVLPALIGETAAQSLLKPKRGRPPLAAPKTHVNIRLDADVLDAFKRQGDGWQTRINGALRDWIRMDQQSKVRSSRGKVAWVGNLDTLRRDK